MDQKGKNRMTTLTIEGLSEALVTQAITAVVAEKGADYTYDLYADGNEGTCVYVKDGKPSCLVAQVMVRLGYDVETLAAIEGTTPLSGRFREAFPGVTTPVAEALSAAQWRQDDGYTWGEALAAYKQELNNNEMENN